MVTLYNVTDIRTGRRYSVAIVKRQYVRYFVPDEVEETDRAKP